MRLFNDHDAALIDDVRREFDALLFVPLTPRDIKLAFEKAVSKVVLRRTKGGGMASQASLAKLSLAMTYMTQEKAFGLDIKFPAKLRHLTNIPIDQLTEVECNKLAEAGMKAHRKALGL
jgi:hypothetical protein